MIDRDIYDPNLSERGLGQCDAMKILLATPLRHVTHILCSPLTRTLQTACLVFQSLIRRGVKILAAPELQTFDLSPNGTGLTLKQLDECFPDHIDFSLMRADWNSAVEKRKEGRYAEIQSRWAFIRGFLKGLQSGTKGREHIEVLIITHSSVLYEWVFDGNYRALIRR